MMTEDQQTQSQLDAALLEACSDRIKWDNYFYHSGCLVRATRLLQAGANPNLRDEVGIPLLSKMALTADLEMVELMLRHKADPTLTDVAGKTALDKVYEYRDMNLSDLQMPIVQANPLEVKNIQKKVAIYAQIEQLLSRALWKKLARQYGISATIVRKAFRMAKLSDQKKAIDSEIKDKERSIAKLSSRRQSLDDQIVTILSGRDGKAILSFAQKFAQNIRVRSK